MLWLAHATDPHERVNGTVMTSTTEGVSWDLTMEIPTAIEHEPFAYSGEWALSAPIIPLHVGAPIVRA